MSSRSPHLVVARAAFVAIGVCLAACSFTSLDYLGADATGGGGPASTTASSGSPVSVSSGSAGGAGGGDGAGGTGGEACPGVDLDADPGNCGRCGRDCLDAACEAGRCLPIPLATGLGEPQEIALDATHVYFSEHAASEDEGGIYRTSKDEDTTERLTPALRARAIAVDDLVYFTADDRLFRVPLSGGLPTELFGGEGLRARAVALDPGDPSTLFFCAYPEGDENDDLPLPVHRAARDGSGTPELIATAVRCESLLASGSDLFLGGAPLLTMPKDGVEGDAEPLWSATSRTARRIAGDDDHISWTEYTAAEVYGARREGGEIEILASGPEAVGVGSVAVDETHVYWTIAPNIEAPTYAREGYVMRWRKGASVADAEELWHSPDARCIGIGLDDEAVYFTVEETASGAADGKVMKLAK